MSIETVGVVGCGQMGLGVVEVVAGAGYSVIGLKATAGDLAKVKARVEKSLGRRVKKGKLSEEEAQAILGRITLTHEISDLADCDLVVESALEDFETKSKLLRDLEGVMSAGAILASNTSSLPLMKLADAVRRPEQLVALHFFNPAQVMKLVELGVTDRTAPGVLAASRAFVESIGKTPVEVSASPGYVVNRLLVPYLLHAIETFEEGIADAPAVDAAMQLGCNHPIGPLALADLIGLDVVMAMATTLQRELADSRYRVPSLLRRLVADHQLGRKSGVGLYDYSGETPVTNPALRPLADAAE